MKRLLLPRQRAFNNPSKTGALIQRTPDDLALSAWMTQVNYCPNLGNIHLASLTDRVFVIRFCFILASSLSCMALYLLIDKIIALVPMATMPIANTVNAMFTLQSTLSPIDAAARNQTRVFVLYIVVVVIGALLTAGLTVWLWSATNRYQEAVKGDADARIEEAKAGAAKASETAKRLEHDNLVLRNDLNTEIGKVAGLQKDAADAKAAQQKVETDLAKQQEKTANAERALLELQRRIEPRRISTEQRKRLVEMLSIGPKGAVTIACVLGDAEGCSFAQQIADVVNASGWPHTGVDQAVYTGNPVGFGIIVRNAITAPPHAAVLQRAFFSVGIPLAGAERPEQPEGTVEILVGNKPNPPN